MSPRWPTGPDFDPESIGRLRLKRERQTRNRYYILSPHHVSDVPPPMKTKIKDFFATVWAAWKHLWSEVKTTVETAVDRQPWDSNPNPVDPIIPVVSVAPELPVVPITEIHNEDDWDYHPVDKPIAPEPKPAKKPVKHEEAKPKKKAKTKKRYR